MTAPGIKFGIVEKHQFAAIPVAKADGSTGMLGFDESAAIFGHLKTQGFVDAKGKVQDALRTALKDGTFALPKAVARHLAAALELMRKVAGKLDIRNADESVVVKTRLRTHIQQMTVAAMQTAARKLVAFRSYRVAMRRKSSSRQNIRSMAFRLR